MYLADSFIQRNLHCIQVPRFVMGIKPMTLVLLAEWCIIWVIGVS